MTVEGPPLESLTHRLADCPAEFLLPPGEISVAALAADHFRAMGVRFPALQLPSDARDLSLIALATWLLHDDFFLAAAAPAGRGETAPAAARLFTEGLHKLSQVTTAQQCVQDADRREEFARVCLAQLGMRPRGETAAQAEDRLKALDSVERERITRDTRAAEARARKIREEMAAQEAREAAARYSPE